MMKPRKRPQRGLNWLQDIIDDNARKIKGDVILIGIRGYYLDSMGVKGKNDRGIYDDALFWVNRRTGFLATYNANVDPSRYRKGHGKGSSKGMASLKNGVWLYKKGPHPLRNGYPAFRQAAPVTVIRDGSPDYEDSGFLGINLHKGGRTTTSSLGCQTLPPTQWEDFRATGYKLLADAKQSVFNYILVERQG
jgi:hypothetical protein